MKVRLMAVMAAVGMAIASWTGLAQTSGGNQGNDQWGQLRAYLESLKTKWNQKKDQLPDRPLPPLPDDIKKMIDEARTAAKDFITVQKDLAKTLKDADQDKREEIRDAMKANLDAFREAQKGRVEEIKKRLTEIKDQFKDNHDRLIDAAKENHQHGRPK